MGPSSAISAFKAQRLNEDSDATTRSADGGFTPAVSDDGERSFTANDFTEDQEEIIIQLSNFLENDHTPRAEEGYIAYGLKNKNSLVIRGQCKLIVRKGIVKVNGIAIAAGNATYDIYSPTCSSLTVIDCEERLPKGTSIESIDSYPAVIELHNLVSGMEDINRIIPRFKSLWKLASTTHTFEVLRDGPESTPRMIIFESWQDLGEKILLNTNNSEMASPTVVIVGPKSSGKSAFAKFLSNLLLSATDGTYYLELDPGQTEYCPCGTISLHKPSKHNFGPPFTHADFVDCVKAVSLGYLSPRERPLLYLSQARELLQTYQSACEQDPAPLIVNTPGWTKGLGAELVSEIINAARPQLVVHLGDEDSIAELGQLLTYPVEIVPLQSARDQVPPKMQYTAADMRTLQIMTYLQNKNFRLHMTEIAPFSVPYAGDISTGISAIGILDAQGLVYKDVNLAINGTLVAILSIDGAASLDTVSTPDEIPYLTPASVDAVLEDASSKCLGYAVIQSVDTSTRSLRILTPTPPSSIEVAYNTGQRIVLMRGRLQLPLWAIWDHRSTANVSKIPYLSKSGVGAGSEAKRVRRNVQRRG